MKIVVTEQAQLSDKEIEILRKIKQNCLGQFDCEGCLFDNGDGNCNMTAVWTRLKKLNVEYENIK